jgi:hypothetical protein
MTPLFRWEGHYWGFVADGQVYDRYGRHVAWLEPGPEGTDVYALTGRFLGELRDEHYVVRRLYRGEPIHRQAPAPAHRRIVLDPPSDREPRDPHEDLRESLPWPLTPPLPDRL